MKNSVKTNSVKATISTAKKVAKKSENVILKTQINQNWKLATRSLSGLTRYAKGEGAKDLQKLIDATNKKEGVKVSLNQVANTKNIVANATERELNFNANPDKSKGAKFIKGDKKELFSFWLVLLTVGRIAKVEKLKLAKAI